MFFFNLILLLLSMVATVFGVAKGGEFALIWFRYNCPRAVVGVTEWCQHPSGYCKIVCKWGSGPATFVSSDNGRYWDSSQGYVTAAFRDRLRAHHLEQSNIFSGES